MFYFILDKTVQNILAYSCARGSEFFLKIIFKLEETKDFKKIKSEIPVKILQLLR